MNKLDMDQIEFKKYRVPAAIIAVCVLIGLSPFMVESQFIDSNQFSMDTKVWVVSDGNQSGNLTLGLNNGRNLDYGRLEQNVNITKKLNITASKRTYVFLEADGNISEYLGYSDYTVVQGSSQIPISLESKNPGNYTGTVTIKTRTPTNGIGEQWLKIKSSF